MRELRVEDALMYLDQVKMEFGDRPHIYNEFLDIMKKFKCQEIDTPGVIQRVSSLFHGNKKLVLGFNTFLPEGYKIELPIDGAGPAVYRAPGQAGVTAIHVHAPPGPGPEPRREMGGQHSSMGSQQPPQQVAGPAPAAVGRPGMPPQPPHQQQQQAHPSQGPGPSHHHAAAAAAAAAHQHGPGPQSGPPQQPQQHPPPHGPPSHGGPHPQPPHPHTAGAPQPSPHGPPSSHAQIQQQGPPPPSQGSMQRGQQQGQQQHGVVDQPPASAPGAGPHYSQQQQLSHAQGQQQQQQLQMQHAQQAQLQQQGHPRQPQQIGRMPPEQQQRGGARVEPPSEQNNQPHPAHPPVPGRPSQQQPAPPAPTSVVSNQQPPGVPGAHDAKIPGAVTSRMGAHGGPPPPPGHQPPNTTGQIPPYQPGPPHAPPGPHNRPPPPHHQPPHAQPRPPPPHPPQQPPQNQQPQHQAPPQPPQPQQLPQQQPPPPQQPVEFDHAINYVTTIKKRFSTEPETYKKFLEILHTYQKEQRGIKEVLDEVSRLFADHPDLLKEFTYFLPDAVQAQAKAQLDEVAKIAEARKLAKESQDGIRSIASATRRDLGGGSVGVVGSTQRVGAGVGSSAGVVVQSGSGNRGAGNFVAAAAPVPFGATQGRSGDCEREICRSALYGVVSFEPVRPPRRNELTPSQAAFKNGRPKMIPEPPVQPAVAEAAFFDRAKAHLQRKELAPDKPPGSRRHTPHAEFLKCLHLFGAGILNTEELILLLRGLFMQGHAPKSGSNAGGAASNPMVANAANELLREFEEMLIGRGPYAEQERVKKDKSKYGAVTARDYDYSHSEQVTPSYREYPPDFPYDEFHCHSGQSEMEAMVLNSRVVCVGPERTGGSKQRLLFSPEEYDGVKARRNMYEDALFKVEDEAFEVDMAIERNLSALRQVEPIAEEATQLRENEEKDGQPIGRMVYKLKSRSLNSNHIGSIGRLYGDSGDEVIQHLMRYPIVVLPIVHRRLKEKSTEWTSARNEMSKQWGAIRKANYEGSFDVQCYFYRREIERSFVTEQLLEECKRARYLAKHPRKQHHHPATDPFSPRYFTGDANERAMLFQAHIKLAGRKDMPHKDAYQCVTKLVMNGVAKTNADREKVSRIWGEFIAPWFDLPAHWFFHEMRERIRSDKSSCIVKYAPGQRVRTAFGDGHILSMIEGNPSSTLRYKIKLPYGTAFVRPSAIIHILPSTSKAQYARSGGFMEFVEHPEEKMDGQQTRTLDKSCHILFGTEKTYIFMRLYFYLVSLLADAKEHLRVKLSRYSKNGKSNPGFHSILKPDNEKAPENESDPKSDTVAKNQKQKSYTGYQGLVLALQDYISGDIDYKTYEASCRHQTKEKVSQLAALPRLVEKCAESLVKVAREDIILSLFDLSQLKHMDPIHLRSQCFGVTNDATYRIQYQPSDGHISFMYLPMEVDLLTAPKSGLLQSSGVANVDHAMGGDDGNAMMIDGDDGGHRKLDKEHFQPQAKRFKLK